MAYLLEKKETTSTPYVLIDEEKGYMKLAGRCFHENVGVFFKEINDWLDGYMPSEFKSFIFDCELNYFNSSTTKLLNNILKIIDEHASSEKKVTVNWIVDEDNDMMIECGEDFKEDMERLEFNIVII